MDDLTAFVSARLDEEEAEVKGPPGWRLEHWTAVKYADKESGRNWRVDAEPRCVVDAVAEEDAFFIARHDPARVLREVEAKRKRLASYIAARADADRYDDQYMAGVASGLADAIKDDADAWSDHPDYRPEWAPANAG